MASKHIKLDSNFMGICSGKHNRTSLAYRSLECVSKEKSYLYLSMSHGIEWLSTSCGKYWLATTQNGKGWLKTSDGEKWLRSFDGHMFTNFHVSIDH